MRLPLDERPLIVAIAGPNGAGKTTFYEAFVRPSGLLFLNADQVARELKVDAYKAAELINVYREKAVADGLSFVFETVLSDPKGDKIHFLRSAVERGYHVVLIFIGVPNADVSDERVAMRVSQGGHDVPEDKLRARYPRILTNLARAIKYLPWVLVFDNGDLSRPYQRVATFHNGEFRQAQVWPEWFETAFSQIPSV